MEEGGLELKKNPERQIRQKKVERLHEMSNEDA